MAYWFTGFFVRPSIVRPAELPVNANWRSIFAPFHGIGLRLPDLDGELPPIETVREVATVCGFDEAESWIFLKYVCWGGRIDSVYGFCCSPLDELGPVKESNSDNAQLEFITLMRHFGISAEDTMDFAPFRRGFWSDA